MSFVAFSPVLRRVLVVLLAAAPLSASIAGTGYAADAKRRPPVAVLPSPDAMTDAPSGAERVGKLLAERSTSSDPDVPLPQRDLVAPEQRYAPLAGPRVYGRGEEGSVVLGLKFPIPADRGSSQQDTRYSSGGTAADAGGRGR